MEPSFSRLGEFASREEICDFGSWLEWFLWDTLALVMFSKKFGFLDKVQGVDNIIHDVAKQLDFSSLVRYIQNLPYLDTCIREGERISPGVGLPLERVALHEGVTICGEFIQKAPSSAIIVGWSTVTRRYSSPALRNGDLKEGCAVTRSGEIWSGTTLTVCIPFWGR